MNRKVVLGVFALFALALTIGGVLAAPGDILAQFPNGTAGNDFQGSGGFITYSGSTIVMTVDSPNTYENNRTAGPTWAGKVLNVSLIYQDDSQSFSSGKSFFFGLHNVTNAAPNSGASWWSIYCGNLHASNWQTGAGGCGTAGPARVAGNATLGIWANTSATSNNVKFYFNGALVSTGSHTFVGNPNVVGFYHGNTISANTLMYNLTVCEDYCAVPAGTTVTPEWVAPTPADGSANNTQVTLNASSADADRYFVWFDTNPDPVTLVVNNATTGNYTTSVPGTTLTYYYKAQAWNASLGYSENSTVQSWTFDAVNPAIVLNPSNEFNAQNYSLQSPYDGLVDLNITFTDDHDLYGMSVNITRGGTVYYNLTNESLSGTSYTFATSINSSAWPVGEYNVTVFVSDSHTAREIPDYKVTRKKSSITFKTEEDNNIKIEARESSTIEATKLVDRYEFSVAFDDGRTKARTFDVKTDKCPLVYRSGSGYKAHFVSTCGRGGNWIDFEGVPGIPIVERLDDFHYTVSFAELAPSVTFRSIGGLNVLSVNYTFYQGEYATSTPAGLALEFVTLALNLTTESRIANITSTLTYNGTTYDPSTMSSSSLYEFTRSVQTPNATVNLTPYWTVLVTQGDGNTSLFNVSVAQSVYDWVIGACGSPAFINWTQYDEDTPSNKLTGTFAVEIEYWVNNRSNAKLYNESFGSGTSWSVCFTPASETFYGNIYGQNSVPNSFTHRFYVQNGTFSNETTYYALYNVNASNALEYSDMKITARYVSDYGYFPNVFGHLQRRYVGEGVWRTVQYDKSGDFGLIFFDVREAFIDYRIKYYDENNSLLLETESLKFICTSGVCELTQLLDSSSATIVEPDVASSWEYDNETSILTITWESPGAQESTVAITVTKEAMSGTTTVCSTSQTGVAGSFACNATGYTGELFVAVDVEGEPSNGGFVQTTRGAISGILSGAMSALVTFLLMVTIIGFGLFSPMALVISTILSLIVVFFLGTAPYINATFIIIAAAIGFAISVKVKQ